MLADRAYKPTKQQLLAAFGGRVPDIIAPELKVLFCGINPGLYSAAVKHHFARPGNRFWPTLHGAGFTSRVISPFDEEELLTLGYGITNVVPRATAGADELEAREYPAGAKRLVRKVLRHEPKYLAILGVGAYRLAFERKTATVGFQSDHTIGTTKVWVLPNPSGLNAHYQREALAEAFRELREASER
jgi:double-stranded uracil-DNA glycosylase